LVAVDTKTTKRPSSLISGATLLPFAWTPPVATLTRSTVRFVRSRTKMSPTLLVSFGTRFVASERNATRVPSPFNAKD
jgi:hypothetical protein